MTKLLLTLLLTITYSQASCKEYKLLGLENQSQTDINYKDTIVWNKKGSTWSVSVPLKSYKLTKKTCKDSGYVLVANNDMAYKTLLHHKNYYDLKKGWNYITTTKDGVDVAQTFKDVEFVYVYDKRSQAWAGYSPKEELKKKMKSTRILELRYLEPRRGFYVLSSKDQRVNISSKLPSTQCQKIMNDKNYDVIFDSGIDAEFSYNPIKSIAFASRYHSHNRKGIYNDSRVVIMTPKLKKLSTNKITKKYGPAIPKIMIYFNEAYAEQEFYSYDFLNEDCRKGYFPSKRKPPAPMMKKVQ